MSFVYRALDPALPPNSERFDTLAIQTYATERDFGFGRAGPRLNVTNSVADVAVSISGSSSVRVGQSASFTIRFENLGPAAAMGTQLTLESPGVEFTSTGFSNCTFTVAKDRVVCSLPQMPSGNSTFGTINGTARAEGSFTAQASVTVGAVDNDMTNNVASHAFTATAAPVTPPAPPAASGGGGGGGGGAMDPILLLLLGCAWAVPALCSRADPRQCARVNWPQ